jgi:hypothetical protein
LTGPLQTRYPSEHRAEGIPSGDLNHDGDVTTSTRYQ